MKYGTYLTNELVQERLAVFESVRMPFVTMDFTERVEVLGGYDNESAKIVPH